MSDEKELRKEVRELKKQVMFYRDEHERAIGRYRITRGWINNKFEWFIDLLQEGKSPCLKYLIKDIKDLRLK